jgi:8-oxo-dGTP pyrophosphatase MutT (NUDIX family)
MDLVRAAGGVVWHEGPRGPRLALVHRPSRGDWSLPKGKLDEGEAWQDAALREIAEETGCEARLTRFAGAKLFLDRRVPKLVIYWHMRVTREGVLADDQEVDEVAWLSPREALSRLDHWSDRRLLLRALSGGALRRGSGRPVETGRGREALRKLLVLDDRRSDEELAPFLELLEGAVASEARRAGRSASLSRR